MKLRIATPLSIVVAEDDVRVLRAEDASGSFGIQPHHADFLTSLSISVVSWQGRDGARRHCAVRHGVLSVSGGDVAIATREAVVGDDMATLADSVLARFRADAETERAVHTDSARLQINAIREMVRHLRPAGRGGSANFA
jgi:F-type H+-transporting ATPase subunit epsilon